MPTYEYQCQQCHERVEAVQKFTDAALTVCPLCGGELRKVFSAVGIVFKGSGFYKNDSRGSKSEVSKADSPTSESSKSDSSPTPKVDATPATTATTPASSTSSSVSSAPSTSTSSTSSD
ncbi:MAG: FmdB family zinc ribbon protein [Acidimicrobiales bacterium]|jgi:putative FmdB family regulatory protein